MIILIRVFIILTIFLSPLFIFGDSHNKQNNCAEDDIAKLYDLIYGNYLPFEPPLDEEGNISVSPEELFVMESKLGKIGKSKIPSRASYPTLTRSPISSSRLRIRLNR